MWRAGSYFLDQGSIPCPSQWKNWFLTTGLPGKAQSLHFLTFLLISSTCIWTHRCPSFCRSLPSASFPILEWYHYLASAPSQKPGNRPGLFLLLSPRDQSISKSYDSALGISHLLSIYLHHLGLPKWCSSKEPTGNAGDAGSMPEWGRSPGGGNGNPLQYPFLEDSKDRGAWCATVHGVAKSQTRLSDWAHKHTITFHQPTGISHAWMTAAVSSLVSPCTHSYDTFSCNLLVNRPPGTIPVLIYIHL